MTQLDKYLLIILRSNGDEVFVCENPDGVKLPETVAQRHGRLAHDLTQAIRERWGLTTLSLFSATPSTTADEWRVQVLECLGMATSCLSSRWISTRLATSDLPTDEANLLSRALGELQEYVSGKRHGTFAKPGWMSLVLEWAADSIRTRGLQLTGRWTQFGTCLQQALVRLETSGAAVWFKAVGEAPEEFNVMTNLVQLAPRFFPDVLAARADWRAWLAGEAAGATLDLVTDSQQWISAAESLGGLQAAFCGREDLLSPLGLSDCRAGVVMTAIEPLFDAMERLMRQQPVTSASAPLPDDRLKHLAERVRIICDRFFSLLAPSTLNNLDLNATNVICSPDQVVFIDWSAAAIGHPFITLEFLIANLGRVRRDTHDVAGDCRRAYARRMQSDFSFEQIDEQLLLSPIVAEFVYTATCWQGATRLATDRCDPLLRSMARRMLRDVDALCSMEAV